MAFIDDTSAHVLDSIYRICKDYCDKKEAEKVVKNAIKLVVKIGVLYRNEQFNEEELRIACEFHQKFHVIVMTVLSFYDVDFSVDINFLIKHTHDCHQLIKRLIQRHLTDKTIARADHVFGFFMNPDLLGVVFDKSGPYRTQLKTIIDDLNKMVDDKTV